MSLLRVRGGDFLSPVQALQFRGSLTYNMARNVNMRPCSARLSYPQPATRVPVSGL